MYTVLRGVHSTNLVKLDLDLDPDPDLDPDLNQDPDLEKLLDPDPHKVNADPQPWSALILFLPQQLYFSLHCAQAAMVPVRCC